MYTRQQLEMIYRLALFVSETVAIDDGQLLNEVVEKTKKLLDKQ